MELSKKKIEAQSLEAPSKKEHFPKKHASFSSENSTEAQIEGQTFKIVNKVYIQEEFYEHPKATLNASPLEEISAVQVEPGKKESSHGINEFAFLDLSEANDEGEFEVVPDHHEKRAKKVSGIVQNNF